MTQDNLRKLITKLHDECGITYKHIANKLDITSAFVNLWLKKDRDFSEKTIAKAENYIKSLKEIIDNE